MVAGLVGLVNGDGTNTSPRCPGPKLAELAVADEERTTLQRFWVDFVEDAGVAVEVIWDLLVFLALGLSA